MSYYTKQVQTDDLGKVEQLQQPQQQKDNVIARRLSRTKKVSLQREDSLCFPSSLEPLMMTIARISLPTVTRRRNDEPLTTDP